MPGSPRGQLAWGGGGIEFAINVVESNLALVRQFDRFAASKRLIFKATDNDCVRGQFPTSLESKLSVPIDCIA